MRKLIVISFLFSIYFQATAQGSSSVEEAIKSAMQAQQDAWNKADIPTFMEHYWKSPKLQFIGASGPTYGWQNTLERYNKNYPDAATMGKLTFDIINIDKRSNKVYSVVGKFHLSRTIGDAEGHFLLIWEKKKGKWVIVADCTSA